MTPEQAREAILPYIYDASTPREKIEQDVILRQPWLPSPEGYMAQLQGILAWEGYSRIGQIAAPTLVIHGKSDALVPAANGELIARRIPGAKLVLLEHASHLFLTDQTQAANKEIVEFIPSQAGGEPDPEPGGHEPLPARKPSQTGIPGTHTSSSKQFI
jgi:pimeloyl-ACP methyl ester carboxylesterase